MTKWLKRHYLPAVMFAYTFATLSIVIVIGIILKNHFDSITNNQKSDISAQEASLISGCGRLNSLRAETNRSHLANYRSDKADLAVFRVIYRESSMRVRSLTPEQRHFERLFLVPLRESIDVKKQSIRAEEWTPKTDCTKAVSESGSSYQSPPAIAFVVKMPPASALEP